MLIIIVSICVLIRQGYILYKVQWGVLIRQYLIECKVKYNKWRYSSGYRWVIKSYFVDQIDFKTIEKHRYNSNSAFDRGCREALFKISAGE